MKQTLISILLVMVWLGISGCAESNIGVLKVRSGENEIKTSLLSTPKSESSTNSEESEFRFAFEQEASNNIQYLKVGETITLDFGDSQPDTISIKDSVLNKSGDYQYPSKLSIEVPLTKENGKYNFKINKHMTSLLSSFFEENKKDYRGFSITATWGEEEFRYAFVVQTDAF